MLDQTLQRRHAPLQLALRAEAHDSDHGEAAVVDLGEEALFLGLGGEGLVPTEGIVEVEGTAGDVLVVEVREVS